MAFIVRFEMEIFYVKMEEYASNTIILLTLEFTFINAVDVKRVIYSLIGQIFYLANKTIFGSILSVSSAIVYCFVQSHQLKRPVSSRKFYRDQFNFRVIVCPKYNYCKWKSIEQISFLLKLLKYLHLITFDPYLRFY